VSEQRQAALGSNLADARHFAGALREEVAKLCGSGVAGPEAAALGTTNEETAWCPTAAIGHTASGPKLPDRNSTILGNVELGTGAYGRRSRPQQILLLRPRDASSTAFSELAALASRGARRVPLICSLCWTASRIKVDYFVDAPVKTARPSEKRVREGGTGFAVRLGR
jgi:hypothetical protein